MSSWRQKVNELDFSGFVSSSPGEVGGTVIKARRGRSDKAVLVQSEKGVIANFGKPSAEYPEVFEILAFVKEAPCYVTCAIGADALYGGVDVLEDTVVAFSAGEVSLENFVYVETTDDGISHSFLTSSPNAEVYGIDVEWTKGQQYIATIYEKVKGKWAKIDSYEYSLIRENDNFGKSLYYEDIFFENSYVEIKVNTGFTGTQAEITTSVIELVGGDRGEAPTASNYNTQFTTIFSDSTKYEVNILFDVNGLSPTQINTVIQTYQPYAQGITMLPFGTAKSSLASTRETIAIDSDDLAIYTGWKKIKDTYNNSMAWVSLAGSVARKYAQVGVAYDGLSPAGIDENGIGGQINDWTIVESELSFTDAELKALDLKQINPIIQDPDYGCMIFGDKTMQVSLSDTSYVGTRRLYKFIIKTVLNQVLRRQEFKLNDSTHRLTAKMMTDDFLAPIVTKGLLDYAEVQCDEDNNTDEVKTRRDFVLDIFVIATTNAQETTLNLIRLPQGTTASTIS